MPARKSKSSRPNQSANVLAALQWPPPDRAQFINPWDNRLVLDYYLALLRAHGYIRLLGLPQLKDNPDIPIESLFVEPEFSEQQITPDIPVSQWPKRTTVTEAITKHPRIVVLGDPGAGKTSLMQWLVAQFCRSGKSLLQERLGPLVPMPFILRELPLTTKLNWDTLFDLFLSQPIAAALRGDRQLTDLLLRSGQALIILDGLDEVSSAEIKQALRASVLEGILRFRSCRWLMTSRVVGYDKTPFHTFADHHKTIDPGGELVAESDEPTFSNILAKIGVLVGEALTNVMMASSTLLYLAPFDDRQINTLVNNWYTEREAEPARRNESIRELLTAIREHPGTERLARIPNLLTMMALIHRVRARLPQGRVNLYNDIADAYLQTIDDFRGIREVSYSLPQKKRWLARLAFQMQRQRVTYPSTRDDSGWGLLIDRPTIVIWLATAFEDVDVLHREAAVLKFIDYIQRRTGLFLERSPGQFSFLHMSFQEYFAACYLADEVTSPDWLSVDYNVEGAGPGDLRNYTNQPMWKETLVFMFELLGQERPRWVDAVARKVFQDTIKKPKRSGSKDIDELFHWPMDTDVVLLADLSVDSYSGMSQSLRETCWMTVWRCSFPDGAWTVGNPSADALFAGAPQFLDGIWRALATVAQNHPGKLLNLCECKHLTDISPIQPAESLEQVYLTRSPIKHGLAALATLPKLRTLDLRWPGDWKDAGSLAECTHLNWLGINSSQEKLAVSSIPVLPSVRLLSLSDYGELEDCESFENWKEINHLSLWRSDLEQTEAPQELSFLKTLPKLNSLYLSSYPIKRLDEIPLGSYLDDLGLWNLDAFRDLRVNKFIQRLKRLTIYRCPELFDLTSLGELANLESLKLDFCMKVVSLSTLIHCPRLKRIEIRHCPELKEVPPALEPIIIRKA